MRYPIKGFQLSSLIEWEGHITSVLFLSGCNFRCGFCHNPALVESKVSDESFSLDEILRQLERERGWIDAVAITGGEPTCSPQLSQLVKELKKKGLKIQIETNGSHPKKIKSLSDQGLVDYVAMDFKAPLDSRYQMLTGCNVDVSLIRESIDFLLSNSVDYEFRTTVVPLFHDEKELIEMAREVSKAKRYLIQRFNNKTTLEPQWSTVEPYSEEKMGQLMRAMQKECPAVRLRYNL